MVLQTLGDLTFLIFPNILSDDYTLAHEHYGGLFIYGHVDLAALLSCLLLESIITFLSRVVFLTSLS